LFQIIFEHMSANFHPLVLFIKRGHKRHPVTEAFSFLLVFAFMQIFSFLRWRRRSCNTNFEQGQKKTNRKLQLRNSNFQLLMAETELPKTINNDYCLLVFFEWDLPQHGVQYIIWILKFDLHVQNNYLIICNGLFENSE
jgi:hypothetical protein